MASSYYVRTRPKPVHGAWPKPPRGGQCTRVPELFHTVGTNVGALGAHVCLAHCPVLQECRRYAEHYVWMHVVIAGQHWVMRRGNPVPSGVEPTNDGCAICEHRPWKRRPSRA